MQAAYEVAADGGQHFYNCSIAKEHYQNQTEQVARSGVAGQNEIDCRKTRDQHWGLRDTVLFLGVWKQINSPAFNSLEFEGIRNEAGRNSFYLSAKKWIDATGAIGLHAKASRYG